MYVLFTERQKSHKHIKFTVICGSSWKVFVLTTPLKQNIWDDLPGEGREKEAVKHNWTKFFWSKLIRQQSEVSCQQVQEDVPKCHVIIGVNCGRRTNAHATFQSRRADFLVSPVYVRPAAIVSGSFIWCDKTNCSVSIHDMFYSVTIQGSLHSPREGRSLCRAFLFLSLAIWNI